MYINTSTHELTNTSPHQHNRQHMNTSMSQDVPYLYDLLAGGTRFHIKDLISGNLPLTLQVQLETFCD
jgi:hypothetical protein